MIGSRVANRDPNPWGTAHETWNYGGIRERESELRADLRAAVRDAGEDRHTAHGPRQVFLDSVRLC